MKIEIKYDGKWPCLCMGHLTGDNILGASIVLEKYDKTKNTK